MSSQRRDFRRMLYRLDLATSYPSIPALIQHFMDETALDGVVEVKLVASPPIPATRFTKGKRSTKPPPPPPPPLQPTTSVISFRREGRDVNAIALFGPASRPPSIMMTEEQGSSHGFESTLAALGFPEMVVKKRYPPRTTLVWVFAPLVQKLLDAGADTVMFEVRSYIAGADSVRESQSALSPVSPYGVAHSATEASPSVLASGSTPSSGMGSGYDDAPTTQHARSPTAYPHTDNKAPILTELHRRPRELRAEATSYEPLRPSHYSPVQRHSSMPEPSPEATAPHWSYPQPGAWSTATGYSDLQPLPPAPTWEASLGSEGWNESSGPTWQSDPATVPYGYSTIPPLPWQVPQHSPYTPSALEPIADQTYFDTTTSPSFHEGFYVPDSGLDDQQSFPSAVPGTVAPQSGGDPMGEYASPSIRFRGDNQNASWQMQYPYFGALDIPPGEAFSYSNPPQVQEATAVSEFNQHSSTGSPASPPDSSERDSLTPTLTNPGYDRSSAPAPVPVASPRKQWPFARGHENPFGYRSVSAYTPVAPSTGPPRPPAARSVSSMFPRSRVRLRSGSPEPSREASIRGAKRLKVNPSFPTSSHIHPVDVASPPPLSASSSNSAHRSIKSRVSSTVRSVSGARASHKTISPVDQMPGQEQPELDTSLLEILTRPAPYKRMLGYAARQHDGSITAYELSDSVAVTTGSDTLLGLGLSSVTNVAALGMELGRRAAHKQQQQESSLRTAVTSNTYGEHAAAQEPRGGDRTGYLRGVTSKPKWQGCVIA